MQTTRTNQIYLIQVGCHHVIHMTSRPIRLQRWRQSPRPLLLVRSRAPQWPRNTVLNVLIVRKSLERAEIDNPGLRTQEMYQMTQKSQIQVWETHFPSPIRRFHQFRAKKLNEKMKKIYRLSIKSINLRNRSSGSEPNLPITSRIFSILEKSTPISYEKILKSFAKRPFENKNSSNRKNKFSSRKSSKPSCNFVLIVQLPNRLPQSKYFLAT